jgi:RNA polymerase sigma-70 factor (ECF subfamily)
MRRARLSTVASDDPAEIESLSAAVSADTFSDPIETAALGRALDEALNRLRPEYRAAIMLRYEEGLSFDDIGHVLNVPESTARSYVHRGRKQLAARLAQTGWRP